MFDVYPLLFGLESPETKSEVEISDDERKVLGSCTVVQGNDPQSLVVVEYIY